jgi:hypothetical protein
MYDKYNNLITNGNFSLVSTISFYIMPWDMIENPITLHSDGSYSTNVYSRKVVFQEILGINYYQIDSIELNVNPGCQYEKDIHILDDIVGVKGNKYEADYDIRVMNYPNPFNSSTNFAITIPSSQKYRQKQINIYNALGQKINSIALSNQLLEQWDGKDYTGKAAATGIYYYQLVMDNRIYKSGSMILLK